METLKKAAGNKYSFLKNYNLLISKHIVTKERPQNIFVNAQAAYKFDKTDEETMFALIPKTINIEFNHNNIVDVTTKHESIDKGGENVRAFSGLSNLNKNIDEYTMFQLPTDYLLSDHFPVRFTINDKDQKKTLVTFCNNVSLLHSRGYVDNSQNFKNDVTLEKLEQTSNELKEKFTEFLKEHTNEPTMDLKDLSNLNVQVAIPGGYAVFVF